MVGGIVLAWPQRHAIVSKATGMEKMRKIRKRVLPELADSLGKSELAPGAPVFIRIFKESKELELWMQAKKAGPGADADGRWVLFKTYPVSNYGTGTLGPKLAEGDGQAPTGFYTVTSKQLKPDSSYHLAFNLGFPNAYDKGKGRTGSFLMVHGSTASIGCYAMTDPLIEEIYLLVEAALDGGQKSVPVHAFPFRMTDARMKKAASGSAEKPWLEEWRNLREGYESFETRKAPPAVRFGENGKYHFGPSGPGQSPDS